MSFLWIKQACVLSLLAAGACSSEPGNTSATDENHIEANAQEEREQADLNEVELPPMVTRSPAYRCDDGGSLYVDVLSDDSAVLVRDSRAEIPVRLERDAEDGAFTGEDRTLSGTGAQVTYSSPERPRQGCREAQ